MSCLKNEASIASIKQKILPLSRQSEIRNEWLVKRLDDLLPRLMQETGIDFWIVIGREFNEDPVMKTLFLYPENSTGRLGIFAFYFNGEGNVERYSCYNEGGRFSEIYTPIWNENDGTQWDCLYKLIEDKAPKKIGINFSENIAKADGISSYHYKKLIETIKPENAKKIVSAEPLVVRWFESRISEELDVYDGICYIMHSIISEVFSSSIIHPGITTTDEVQCIFMEKIKEVGCECNFPPDVNVQRKGNTTKRISGTTIIPGDIVRCDVGLEYLGLNVDIQRLAYVLNRGEEDAPQYIKDAFNKGKQFQDIVCRNFVEGRTGNEIFFSSVDEAKKNGITARLYSHPIGYHVHGAGPTIGLWNNQGFVPGAGEFKLNNNTCYALELNVKTLVPEWGQDITICLEEDIVFTNGKTYFLNGREEHLYLIK